MRKSLYEMMWERLNEKEPDIAFLLQFVRQLNSKRILKVQKNNKLLNKQLKEARNHLNRLLDNNSVLFHLFEDYELNQIDRKTLFKQLSVIENTAINERSLILFLEESDIIN